MIAETRQAQQQQKVTAATPAVAASQAQHEQAARVVGKPRQAQRQQNANAAPRAVAAFQAQHEQAARVAGRFESESILQKNLQTVSSN